MKKYIWAIVGMMLLTGCGSEDSTENLGAVPLRMDVAEQGWEGETVSVTRVGETLEELKTSGFGLYSNTLFSSAQRQVTWNSSTGQWNIGQDVYWKHTSNDVSTFDVYAYAPYKSPPYTVDVANGLLTYNWTADASNPDLLYAKATVKKSDGKASLTFNHAMAKITFGAISNNTGEDISVKSLAVSGTLYTSGKLNLETGEWTELTTESSSITITDFDTSAEGDQQLAVANGAMVALETDSYLLIPGPGVTITLTMSDDTAYSFSNVLMERGKNKTLNITVAKNFEVVIEN